MSPEKHYNLREAAEILGIKIRTAREWVHKGKLRAHKYPVSNRWYVAESEIERLRNEQQSGE